ncbi:hypothetical protein NC651_024145 [Populus alba x Populus x berolinensis]|nr:hypothetical protein NC651_024145 [Populus alba x Populus x berolinensis]
MSSLGTSKGILEIAKFGVYVTVPVVLMYAFANNTKNLQKFMGNDSVEMEAFEFRLEDKRFPPQQLEMAFIHSVPIKDSKTSVTRGDEGKGSRIGSQEGYSLMLTSSQRIKPKQQEGNACGLLMCMWMRDLADYALNNM